MASWFNTGETPSGMASPVGNLATAASMTREQRIEGALVWLEAVTNHVKSEYLSDGAGVGAMATRRTRVNNISELGRMPMFGEIAEAVLNVTEGLTEKVKRAKGTGGTGVSIL